MEVTKAPILKTPFIEKCDKCENKMNPTVYTYNNHLYLCRDCFQYMDNLDDCIADNLERFLIGNVL